VVANVTAQDAEITNDPQGVTSVGNRPQGAPAYIAYLWTTYDFSITGVPGFHAGAGLDYVSKTYSDITNFNSIPSYVHCECSIRICNASMGY
jgi:iron complex outermembrane recepter protein